jgi:SAM-dependent methyltransferase
MTRYGKWFLALMMLFAAQCCAQSPLAPAARAPSPGTSRSPDVPYQPTPPAVVTGMLELAGVGPNDVVYDLGSGDGRIVIAAAKQFGARGVGVEIDPALVSEARAAAKAAGVAERAQFIEQDLFAASIADATVVMLYLWPEVNLKLRPKLFSELKPGTRVVSHSHDMGDWTPDKAVSVQGKKLFLWVISGQESARQ